MSASRDEITAWAVTYQPDNGDERVVAGIFTDYDRLERWIDAQDETYSFEIRGFVRNRPWPLGDEEVSA